MATRYTITSNGSPLLDVTSSSVSYNSGVMEVTADIGDVYVEFFDNAGAPATPTAGWYFGVFRTQGTNASVVNAFTQSMTA